MMLTGKYQSTLRKVHVQLVEHRAIRWKVVGSVANCITEMFH